MVTVKELEAKVGGLSTPSKMPGFAYGIPAVDCILGSILRKKEGSTCNKCYALKGMYSFPVVQNAQRNRLAILRNDLIQWEKDMIAVIAARYKRKTDPKDRVFRWHDSGDLQSLAHLSAIVRIARVLPDIRFWLPTRENKMVKDWLRASPEGFPTNLIVRISAPMVGQTISSVASGAVYSTVGANTGHACPARNQGNSCGDCRACWDNSVISVDYPLH